LGNFLPFFPPIKGGIIWGRKGFTFFRGGLKEGLLYLRRRGGGRKSWNLKVPEFLGTPFFLKPSFGQGKV